MNRGPEGEKPCGLPRHRRLLRSGDFSRVERQGKRASSAFVVIVVKPGRGRVGFTVSKKVGNAVVRNRVKRCLRDIARRHKGLWVSRDLVIIARPEAAQAERTALEVDVLTNLRRADELVSRPSSSSKNPDQRPPRGVGPSSKGRP